MTAVIPKTQQAALVEKPQPNAPVIVKEIAVPDPSTLKSGECLIKMDCSGVCHSDLSIKNHEYALSAFAKLPLIGGHEGVGTIVAIGAHTPENPTFKIGQRVGIKWLASTCLHCDACTKGSEWHCPKQSFSGLNVDGTFQQYAVGFIDGLVAIPQNLSSQDACPILCAGVTVYKALKSANTKAGEWVAVSGAGGGLGHLAVQYANAMGMRVLAIDSGAEKKKLCETLGSAAWVDFKEGDVVKQVMAVTGGIGVKAALVTAASVGPYNQALQYLAPEGTLLAVGLPPEGSPKMEVDIFGFVGKVQRIQASYVGNRQDCVEALNLVATGRVKPHYTVKPLSDLQSVFEAMTNGTLTGRVVLDLA